MKSSTYLLFSPYGFGVFFLLSYFLYSTGLAKTISTPAVETTFYVFASIAFYTFGVALGAAAASGPCVEVRKTISEKFAKRALWGMYVLSIMLFAFEHVVFISKYGSFPLFQPDFEVLRFDFPVNGYVHLLAVMNFVILLTLCGIYMYGNSKDGYFRLMLLLAVVLSASFDFLVGNRAAIIGLFVMLLIAGSFKYEFKKKLIVSSVLLLFIFGASKLYRDYMYYGEAVFYSIDNDWFFGGGVLSSALYFVYMGIAMNYSMLNSYIIAMDDFFYGYFSLIQPFYSLLPGQQYGLKDLQLDVLSIDFHGGLTSTILSIPYFDFSYGGVFVLMLIGVVAGYFYSKARLTRSFRYVIPYAYIYWQVLLGVYTYMFDKFYILFNIFFVVYVTRRIVFSRN